MSAAPHDRRRDAARAAGFQVREAVAADAPRLGRVHAQGWQEAYPGLISADALAAATPEHRVARWETILAQPPGATVNLVGVDADDVIMGMGTAGPSRDDDAPTEHELWSLYVLAATYGSGLADLLMERLIGDDAAYLWVLEGNERAQAFYRRHGFVADGARLLDPSVGAYDLRMVRGAAG